MQLTSLSLVLIDRPLVLEADAAHLTALAAIADAYTYVARELADAAQRALSEIKVFLALLPDGTAFELKAPRPNAEAPADVLGVRPRLPVPKSDREFPSCPAPPSPAPPSSAMRPANRETTPTIILAPGPAPG